MHVSVKLGMLQIKKLKSISMNIIYRDMLKLKLILVYIMRMN